MGEKPILFSGPMIRALLDGRKVQTRRILKPQPEVFEVDGKPAPVEVIHVEGMPRPQIAVGRVITHQTLRFAKGDRLWVKETWQSPAMCPPQYRATDTERVGHWDPAVGPWKPSIFMPRWASRLTLTVTDVRVERVQDIGREDAKAEGFPIDHLGNYYEPPPPEVDSWQGYAVASFCLLWSELNGSESWYANPWVCAVSFTVERANIDSVKVAA